MKVDRDRFVALALALAAGAACATPGCNTGQTPPADDPRQSNSPTPPPLGNDQIVIPAPTSTQPSPTAIADPPPPPPPPPSPVRPAPAPPTPTVVVAKSPNPYDGTPIAAQACSPALNAVGTPGRCALTAPGPTCESFSDTTKECPTLTTLLKPRVAEAAIACLRRKSGTKEICEFNVTSICAYEALQSACLDPSAKAACDGVVARCGGSPRSHYNKMTRDACEAGVSGIADAKRKKFIACISESCRFETCLTYL